MVINSRYSQEFNRTIPHQTEASEFSPYHNTGTTATEPPATQAPATEPPATQPTVTTIPTEVTESTVPTRPAPPYVPPVAPPPATPPAEIPPEEIPEETINPYHAPSFEPQATANIDNSQVQIVFNLVENMASDITYTDATGIEIPFPQVVVHQAK